MAENSQKSITQANKSHTDFSGHKNALGAAGHHEETDKELNNHPVHASTVGDSVFVDPHPHGYPDITISLSWDNVIVENAAGFLDKLFKSAKKSVGKTGVDLDLGCLYELQNGARGCLQPFGEMHGAYDKEPFIRLSGDERTGDKDGPDEQMVINGRKWPEIKRVLLYIYIYEGAADWESVKPEIFIDIPGDEDLKMTPYATKSNLMLCAVGMLENQHNGIKMINHSEYFPGHAEMDRAFGFGLEWEDGEKA